MTGRFSSLVIIAGLLAGGLLLQSFDEPTQPPGRPVVEAGVAIPAARTEPSLSSTWYCAAGSTGEGDVGNHVLLLENPTDRDRTATITAAPGTIAPAPPADGAEATTTTAAATTVTTSEPASPLVVRDLPLPAQSRLSVALAEFIPSAPLVSAIVEIDGGEVAVEHEVTTSDGRATAPCSTTASATWSFPWGVTERGARELLVFFNPFPDDATVDITLATDEGVREVQRLQGLVVPGRSSVGAYVEQDTRREQVSAAIAVRGGRVIVDRVQTFDGTDGRAGITLALGAPAAADVWVFPDGYVAEGIRESVIVYNPTDAVAEVDIEVVLADPATNGIPEPFEVTVGPGRYSLVALDLEDRIPPGVAHSILVHSLNGVGVVAERVLVATEGRRGVSAAFGSPVGASTWFFPGGGTSDERDQFLTLFNLSDEVVTVDVVSPTGGQILPIGGLQGQTVQPGGRLSIRLGDHVRREDLPLIVRAEGPIVAERSIFRVGGTGISQAIGIPLDDDITIPDPINT